MNTLSLVLGIISIIGMLIAFIPCLGWLNWFVLPVALIGFVISLVNVTTLEDKEKRPATIGLFLCVITLIFGSIRWFLGGFVL
jgi:hypothetical protein